jgi:ketosteroid isomerase-like protein
MRTLLSVRTIAVLIVGILFITPDARAQKGVAAAEKEVREVMRQYAAAYGSNDLDKYFAFFADDMTAWWGTNGRNDNPTPKAQYQKTYPDSVKKSGGYESCKLDDERVQVSPGADAAIASYKLECIRRNPPPGQQPPVTYQMTSALFKRGNTWKIVHFNWRNAAPPPAATR